MTNYFETARAGRIKALENLAARRAFKASAPQAPAYTAPDRSITLPVQMPVFISQRNRAETPVFLH